MKVGKVSESVLKRSVLRQIGSGNKEAADGAGPGKDCAVFTLSGDLCEPVTVSGAAYGLASCVQEGILVSCAGEKTAPMERLIQKCANNLAAGGFGMAWVMIALILPEEAQEEELKGLMRQAGKKCTELGARIAGGQTRVSDAVREPVAAITGYGLPFAGKDSEGDVFEKGGEEALTETEGPPGAGGGSAAAAPGRAVAAERQGVTPGRTKAAERPGAAAGQDVVVSKWIGLEGTARLAERNREKLLARYPAGLVEEAAGFDRWLSVIPEAATAVKSGVCAMHDASEGGIFGALWELAERAGVGLTIDLKKLPLRQETVEVCECCNINPYELLSGGCLVMTAWDGPELAAALAAEGIPATVVGKVTDSRDRILRNEDEVRYLERPRQDEIYRPG
ncbi:MAG: AIR synthase-related protein [Roseburia sp.]|nr:AIR synthase-related protein [Roseburia sp.]MCM1096626.1 AIR synthase-related protein [Ruminococcus flavefaciens]